MNIINLIFVFLFCFSLHSQEGFNDLKEYGLRGRVKSFESTYYSTKEIQEMWIIDTLKSKSKVDFDENGNITKIVNLSFSESELKIETIEFQRDKNERKISYKKYNEYEVFETGTYKWIDERKYQINSIDSFGIRTESEFTLTKNLRDKSGTTAYFDSKSGEYLLTYKYENILDEYGNLLRSKITYEPIDKSSIMIYDVQELDSMGNWIKINLYYEDEDFRQIMIRKIEYYN
ncbi:MAG TPA: hypothetical protein PKH16_09715 [Aequorivita sp.]|jgi:hypothetical protein|nr:hypothetical protein [Aequorivita sp.]MBP41975.1 hypothetical protein [Aequorivita sp.]HBC03305.1 hypothetical protein [Aequorivita sp.]HNP68169.1 hypothetical protein [Aequorivita sp.]|tara:strand:- start:59291 stop:59986 length:696 start_codon:yes stop_codon:yes gene_type:complete